MADGGLSTPEVYRELDRLRGAGQATAPLGSPDALLAALRQRDPAVLAAALGNDLQAGRPVAAAGAAPRRSTPARAAGALAGLVSGSGPDLRLPVPRTPARARPSRPTLTGGRRLPRPRAPRPGPVPGARAECWTAASAWPTSSTWTG